ncbi:uncharacterized protein LOC101856037 isoform X2 [Aplysia californica]|nr:uncharacterized protein LOC101856037 isoform X2 [Aplysia californica]
MASPREPMYPAIPVLHTRGSYYEVGYNIGFTFADRIKRFWQESVEMKTLVKPFGETERGRQYVGKALKVCKENFPCFIRELQGMADGCGMEFSDLFLVNVSKEIINALSGQEVEPNSLSSGCSEVFINTPKYKLMAHNEDADPMIKPYGYFVKACIVENKKEVENFTAFCYPGFLAGVAFNFNSHGMVFSMNGLYVNIVAESAPPRAFLNRSVIRARTVEEAKSLLRNSPFGSAYSFTVNIVDVKNHKSMWSIEVGPREKESEVHVQEIPEVCDPEKPCHYLHFNSIKHLKNLMSAGIPNPSSITRTQVAEKFPPVTTRQDALKLLGDERDKLYPIFRSDRPTDHSETVFTTMVEPLRNRVEVYQGNPSLPGAQPFMYFNILEGEDGDGDKTS